MCVCVCTRARSVAPQRISESSAFPHTNRSRTARIDAKSHNSVLGYTAKTFKNSELQTFPVMKFEDLTWPTLSHLSHVRYLLNSLSIPIKHNGTARFVSCLGGHIGPWRELVSHGSTTSSCSTWQPDNQAPVLAYNPPGGWNCRCA